MSKCKQCGIEINNSKFCSFNCYGMWQRGKNFSQQGKKERPKKGCSVADCHSIHFGKGYCRRHYVNFILNIKNTPRPRKDKNEYYCKQCGVQFIATLRSGGKIPQFCSSACMGFYIRNPFIIKKGYKKILIPDHPRADGKGYVFEHIVIMESVLGRPIINGEECHHIDHNKLNNSPSNLEIYKNHADHMKSHARPPK